MSLLTQFKAVTDLAVLQSAVSVLVCYDVTVVATFTTDEGVPEIMMLSTPLTKGITVTDIRPTDDGEHMPLLPPGIQEWSGNFMDCRLFWQEGKRLYS